MKYTRYDSLTGQGMNAGYCICDGDAYASNDETLLIQLMAIEPSGESEVVSEYLERCYEDELYYYTTWEDEDDADDEPTQEELNAVRQAMFNLFRTDQRARTYLYDTTFHLPKDNK